MTKVYIQTQGCSANTAESELMMGLLQEAGYKIVDDLEYSDVNVINICTVKGNYTALREIKKLAEHYPDKKMIVAGCITRELVNPIRKLNQNAALINTHNFHKIVDAVEESIQGNALEALTQERELKVGKPKIRTNKVIGIIPIASGCADQCAYCSVKLIKGKVFSYPEGHILKEIEKNIADGCREIWITSQDNGAYMVDKGERKLAKLLDKITKIDGDFKVRLGMLNPRHIPEMIDELIHVFQDDKMFKFLHIPIEAGNNEVLGKMNRKYTVYNFKEIVERFRRYVKDITIATDIIVGFPSETEAQFHDSLNLIQDIKPDVLNIARFSSRPNTVAAKMKDPVSGEKRKERSKMMTELFTQISLKNNQKWIGWKGKIIIDEYGKNKTFLGRNFAYKPIVVKGDYKLGDEIEVTVKDATTFHLRATPHGKDENEELIQISTSLT
jgi:MiaB-like tRNA modifying enzyme